LHGRWNRADRVLLTLWTSRGSTITEAIMGLLDILGGSGPQRGGAGMSPMTMALLGLLAYRTYQGKGRLADMIGRKPGASGAAGGGGLGDLLGGLTGGAAAGGLGGLLSGGLGDLLKQFQQHGQDDKAQSWVSTGPNKPVTPREIEQALGAERIEWLTQQTGMSREELLAGLSRELPDAVDKLTPEGRVPTEQEAARLLQ
jgi:uncharacterized protein YidB (DUF937 family)